MNNCDLYSNPKSKLTVIPYRLFFHSIDNVIVFLLRQNPQPELAFRTLTLSSIMYIMLGL
ncbi:Uncharacterised protein [Serratia entomophila]|nr:Uncharacterised protein [Serratia entomophila]CAI1753232.1 Uncharacterised protein [Serratia entomophila]